MFAIQWTNMALDALEALELPASAATESALAWLGDRRGAQIVKVQALEGNPELAASTAASLLESRNDDGSWNRGRTRMETTATYTMLLSAAYDVLKKAEPASGPGVATPLPAFDPADRVRVLEAQVRGARFLIGASHDGLWGAPGRPEASLTAMAVGALAAVPEPRPEDVQAALDRGVAWLISLQREDGGIHQGTLGNYVTSAAVLAITRATGDEHAEVVARARDYLVRLQADEGEGYSEGDLYYGGVGYGGDERPDLSNLQMALEALNAAGLDPGDDAWAKAVRFLERSQNRTESNDVEIVQAGGGRIVGGNDGGAGYAPGDSKAGFVELADGTQVPRSYGSMTYALLKGYIFAGLERDDPRVEAAFDWVQKNYTLDVNPGFEASSDPTAAYQGLFYYFYTMARALDLYGTDAVVDAAGKPHAWRNELSGRLLSMQRGDGSWINENSPRWWEGNPVLATAYAVLILESALPAAQ